MTPIDATVGINFIVTDGEPFVHAYYINATSGVYYDANDPTHDGQYVNVTDLNDYALFGQLDGNLLSVNRSKTLFRLTAYSQLHLISTSVILGVMILCCIIGNCFVIAAVMLERSLHNVANYLIVSLAVADLMVAVLVMPLSVVSEISSVWFLHSAICDMWISFDVLCCTASILHLVAIALDRYWAVTSINYMRRRSARRILIMIFIVWMAALIISIPPLFGWSEAANDPALTGVCIITQDHSYTIFSTVGAFYMPMFIMICVYARIYIVARRHIRRKKFLKNKHSMKSLTAKCETQHLATQDVTMDTRHREYSAFSDCNGCSNDNMRIGVQHTSHLDRHKAKRKLPVVHTSVKTVVTQDIMSQIKPCILTTTKDNENGCNYNSVEDDTPTDILDCPVPRQELRSPTQSAPFRHCLPTRREKLEQQRERKAARTLSIITGVFLLCWLPFFILALCGPFIRHSVTIPVVVDSILLWLGYLNSLINPIIYTIFSPEFRNAFKKILFGKYSKRL